jgi:hypothetical protein
MSKWVTSYNTWTPTAVADGSSMTTLAYTAIQGGTTTQRFDVTEVEMGGQATSSAPTFMVLAHDSTVGGTPTALSAGTATHGPLDPAAIFATNPTVAFITASTQSIRANTVLMARLNLSFNAFGGIVRWTAMDPSSTFKCLGNAASFGEVSLSAFTGGTPGLLGSHIIYELI